MSLKQALLESINKKWERQYNDAYAFIESVHIHPSLAEAIRKSGEEVPTEFNPNEFNGLEEETYYSLPIEVYVQDELISFLYE
jgi:hypothetical protein